MSWCHLHAAGICMAAGCSKRLTGAHRGGLTHVNPVVAVLMWIISHFLHVLSSLQDFRGLWTRCDNSLGSFCSPLSQNGRYFTAKPLFGLIKQINLDLTNNRTFSHALLLKLTWFVLCFTAWQIVTVRIVFNLLWHRTLFPEKNKTPTTSGIK